MRYDRISADISSKLQLDCTPIGVFFVDHVPAGVEILDEEVPSACSIWTRAQSGMFYASAEKHFHCPVGAMVMGFDLPQEIQTNLTESVGRMCRCNYITSEEPRKIPIMKQKGVGILYGPLKDFAMEPQLIILWLTPRQAMLCNEALGNCRWTDENPTAIFGRPGCAALPVAYENSQFTISFGCTGMRVFTETSENRLLAVLPGTKAQEFVNNRMRGRQKPCCPL